MRCTRRHLCAANGYAYRCRGCDMALDCTTRGMISAGTGKQMKILLRRLWYDMQIGVYGSIVVLLFGLLSHVSASPAFLQFWNSLLWLVPSSIVGTEIARGIHWLLLRFAGPESQTKPKRPTI